MTLYPLRNFLLGIFFLALASLACLQLGSYGYVKRAEWARNSIRQFHHAIRLSPGDYKVRNDLIRILVKDPEMQHEALDEAWAALKLLPFSAMQQGIVGELFERRGDILEAKRYYQKAVALAPVEAVYWLKLGEVNWLLGEKETALESFREALVWMVDDQWYGVITQIAGEEMLFEALPKESDFFRRLAYYYKRQGNHSLAEKAFRGGLEAAEGEPKSKQIRAHMAYARYLRDENRPLEAAEEAQQAIQIEADNFDTLIFAGKEFRKAGRGDSACRHFQVAYKLDPRSKAYWSRFPECFEDTAMG